MFISQTNNQNHNYFMNLALKQAQISLGNTKTNPAVGCVITKNNNVISAGYTSINGRPHAEQNALKISKKNLKNSKLYVTLEPCSHYGKTKPCTNIIIKKKIKKVFFSVNDPDIRSFKKCSIFLNKKKISVKKGFLKNIINDFYRSYVKYKKEILPFVTCKLAVSKDFFTINRRNKWITNFYSRSRVHLLRSCHDCIVTSSQTIIDDNPKLTCRIKGLEKRSPARIILDTKLRISRNSTILKESGLYKTIIFYNTGNKKKINLLKKSKVKIYKIPMNNSGNLDLVKSLIKIKELGFSRIFLEAGMKLSLNFLRNNLVDDFKLFISNKKIGKNGSNNFKKYLNSFLNKNRFTTEKVNLFNDKLISYKLK